MKNKILILFAHPRFERSITNSTLIKRVKRIPEITFHDLYENYPDFNINIDYERKLLTENQIIIWQHPFYWYSSPPLLKQWIDLVLGFGWAYGPGGNALQGKLIFTSITAGGKRSAYCREGHNIHTVKELLIPFDKTATLCKMIYLPPFAVHGTHNISGEEIDQMAQLYFIVLNRLINSEFSTIEILQYNYMNDWITSVISKN